MRNIQNANNDPNTADCTVLFGTAEWVDDLGQARQDAINSRILEHQPTDPQKPIIINKDA